jgi:uncharacterized membrane protein YphA (DoxX/SURF4 family)
MTSHAQQNSALALYRKLAGEDSPIAASWGLLAFRWWGVLMLALTYYKTQLAWGPRPDDSPTPLLPLWDGSPALPQLDLYGPLLLTLALVPLVARLGLILHSVTLFYAIITDLTRIQPECFSPVILLWATLPSDNAKTIARAHLAAMWFFAGFHKLMAPAFAAFVGPEIFTHLLRFKNLDPELAKYLGFSVAIFEMAVGLGVLFPLTRRAAAVAAVLMHFVIFLGATSIPEGIDHLIAGNIEAANEAMKPENWYQPVWPWNLLLMWAGLAFFWNYRESPLSVWRGRTWPIRTAVAVLLISPLGYYLGIVNPYLANCIYSGNFIIGVRIPASTNIIAIPELNTITDTSIPRAWQSLGSETSRDLGISLPPSERMFQRFFTKTGKLHERMILYYPGWMSRFTGIQERELWLGHGEKINGLAEGPWIFYDEAGKKSTEVTFRHGQQNGNCINWRPDGSKESEGPMLNNQLDGTWTFYDPEGTVKATFRNGVRVE